MKMAEKIKDTQQRTYSHILFDVFDPDPDNILIEDIAHALSLQNRFNGHTKVPISVAEHSLFVASILPDELKLEGLLHDASDAYMGDVVSPVKHHHTMRMFRNLENCVQMHIYQKFGIKETEESHAQVKQADNEAYFFEKENFLLRQNMKAKDHVAVEHDFLDAFYSLYDKTNHFNRDPFKRRFEGNIVLKERNNQAGVGH
jgi:5'-deoxynucleotidase YfbR-like HD superfamily hydrolase